MYIYKNRNAEANFNFSNATSFEVFEENGTSSTTSGTYQTKLTATTQTDTIGKYIIQWFAEVANSTNNNTVLFRVQWKPTTSGTWTTLSEPDIFVGRSEIYDGQTGFRVVETVATDTLDVRIEYAAGGATARIRNVNLYVFRVELT